MSTGQMVVMLSGWEVNHGLGEKYWHPPL